MAKHHGRGAVGVIQFDTHADTANIVWGVRLSHGTPMRLAVDEGWIRGDHFIQVGLRGYWPHASEFDWMRSVGMRWHTVYEVGERGIGAVIDTVVAEASDRLPKLVYLIVDVDVLDPGWAPGTGTPEPGGLLPRELLTPALRDRGPVRYRAAPQGQPRAAPAAGELMVTAPSGRPSGLRA
jgi:agmatinase